MSLETQLRRLTYRLLNSTVRGVLKVLQDSGGLQQIQATLLGEDDISDPVERLQDYGFTGSPPLGSECLVLMVGGTRSHPICVKVENRQARKAALSQVQDATQLEFQPGDVMLYTSHENFVLLRSGSGNLILNSPNAIRLQAKHIEIHAAENLSYDCLGNGTHFTPLTRTDYVIGATGSVVPILPPDINPDPAQ
jgi:phage baseplate assembly protein V